MKKNLLFLLGIALSVSILTNGCKKDDDNTSTPTNNNNNNNNSCTNEVISRNDSIIITGCSTIEPTITFGTEGYLLTICEKTYGCVDKFEVYQTAFSTYQNVKAGMASALREDGWYSQSDIWTNLQGSWKWKTTATDTYKIIFAKLPLRKTVVSAPQTYATKGRTVLGPVNLSGNVSFDVTCADAKQAGFTVELFDATTGSKIVDNDGIAVLNLVNYENGQSINNYHKVVNLNLSNANYLIQVSANKDAAWEVKVN